MDYKQIIRQVPGFPKPGINFIDVTTLLTHPEAMASAVKDLVAPYRDSPPDRIVGIEARGFIFGAALRIGTRLRIRPRTEAGKASRCNV